MAIQIIDNFNISVAKPIDDRFVVGPQSFYTDKNDIPYKYSGLRVWDLNDGVPYVWDGSSWASENSVSISGSGNANYVPKFIGSGSSTVLDDSCIYVSGLSVGINNTSITTGYNLDVVGGIRSQGATGFSGIGTLLTNLNATNISSGLLSLSRLTNGSTTGHILVAGASQPNYVDPYSLTVGGASSSTVFNETSSSDLHYINFFSGYSGNLQSRVNKFGIGGQYTTPTPGVKQLTYQPSTGTLTSALMSGGTFSVSSSLIISSAGSVSSPSINFSSYAGIWHTTFGTLGISTSGSGKLLIDQTGVNFGLQSNFYPRISVSSTSTAAAPSYTWYGDTNTGMYRSTADTIGFSTNGVERMSVAIDGIKHINSTFTTGPTFSLGTGTLAQTTMATFSSASYDRVIYMHSSNNTNATYINSPGWVEITAYIGGQQIYSSFFGADSDIRPSFSFSCILPANSLLYIKLQKSTLSYGPGQNPPTIYTTSLKFGL